MKRKYINVNKQKGYVKVGDLVYVFYERYESKGIYKIAAIKKSGSVIVETNKLNMMLDAPYIGGWPGHRDYNQSNLHPDKLYWSVSYVCKAGNVLKNE